MPARNPQPDHSFQMVSAFGPPASPDANRLYHADNLAAVAQLAVENIRPDLIYIDPPFGSQQDFKLGKGPTPRTKSTGERHSHSKADTTSTTAYSDIWAGGIEGYLTMLTPRLEALQRLLADTGSFYIHLDSTVVHYVKVRLDEIFGRNCFQREIIWRIGWISGFKSRAKNWIRNHDTILFYTKHPTQFHFEKQLVPHPAGYQRRAGAAPATKGIPVDDVWNGSPGEAELTGAASLDSIQIKSFSREKTGYPTQKNLALLKRVIAASCPAGGLVADFFCGSGTTLVAAAQLGRRFVGCDAGEQAISTVLARLEKEAPTTGYTLWRGR